MATYDPKRSRPTVGVREDDPAPVEDLVRIPDPDPVATADGSDSGRPVTIHVSPSPFEPAGPPDRNLGRVIAIGVATAGVLALMVALRRRRD